MIKRLHPKAFLTLSLLLAVGTFSSPSHACLCGGVDLSVEVSNSQTIVRGVITEVGTLEDREPAEEACADELWLYHPVTLDVSTVWKGESGPTLVISNHYSDCGRPFEVGEDWIILTHDDQCGGPYTVRPCTWTREADDAEELLGFLDEKFDGGCPPSPSVPAADDLDGGNMVVDGGEAEASIVSCRCVRWAGVKAKAALDVIWVGLLYAGLAVLILLGRRRSPASPSG